MKTFTLAKISRKRMLHIKTLIKEYQDIFTDLPDKEDKVTLTLKEPVSVKQYFILYSKRDEVNEVQKLLKLSINRDSNI